MLREVLEEERERAGNETTPEQEREELVEATSTPKETHAIVEEFLMQFPTIFTDKSIPVTGEWGLEEGQFSWGWEYINGQWQQIISHEVPDIFFRRVLDSWEDSGFYDRYGNRITDAPWMLWDVYATDFSLWSFDDDDMPTIIVYYMGNYVGSGDGGPPASLFRYVDGEFKRVSYLRHQLSPWIDSGEVSYSWFPFQGYYSDEEGSLVGYFYGIVQPIPFYTHITFRNNSALMNVIARSEIDWETHDWENPEYIWTNYLTGESNIVAPAHRPWDSVLFAPRYISRFIPGSNIYLTPIMPLTDLQESITESVTQRLLSEGSALSASSR